VHVKPVLLPLVLAWLALHGALLALILGIKFLGAKMIALLLLLGAAFWLLTGRRSTLPRLSGAV
jgi:hypothetical protein